MENWDLIIVGAGTAGCAAAITARRAGLSVLVLDRKRDPKVGDKACGDAMEQMELDWCQEVLGVDISAAAVLRPLGGRVYTADNSHYLQIPTAMCPRVMMDRPHLGQILLREAKASGATFREVTKVRGWLTENGAVCGVVSETDEIRGRCCIDASGAFSGLRERVDLPGEFLEREVGAGRMAFAYRENVVLTKPVPHPQDIAISYDLAASNGGYVWIFPYSDTRMNVGIGGTAAALPWAQRLYDDLKRRGLEIKEREVAGGAFLPCRTFLACAVAPGYVAVGDAACCVGPLDGAGIHSSLLSGHLGALQVAKALAHGGQATREALWGYQSAYLSYRWNNRIVDHGAGISAMEALRPLLQNVTQDEFDRLVRLADSDTVAALYRYDWSALRSVARVLVALLRQPSLCLRLGTGLYHMLRLRRHLLSYPRTSDDYLDWKCDLDAILRSSGIVPVAHSSP